MDCIQKNTILKCLVFKAFQAHSKMIQPIKNDNLQKNG